MTTLNLVAKFDKDSTKKDNYSLIYPINMEADNPKLDIIKLNLVTL